MKHHPTDLVALLFGLAFAISGAIVIATQATSIDISPQWGAAVGLIVLGVVALTATLTRAGRGRPAPVPVPLPVSPAPGPVATVVDDDDVVVRPGDPTG